MKTPSGLEILQGREKTKEFFQRILVEETLEYKIIFAASQLDINHHPCGGFYCNFSGEFFKVNISAETYKKEVEERIEKEELGKEENENKDAKNKNNEEETAFEPPLTYSLTNIRVDTSDAQSILRDIYHNLQNEKSSENQKPVRKIGFV
ncbi:hypothetical protein HYX13_01915 [Candidatus Woesearchaeota archaeon]|nr:hypothetical protein [Candidatus Woesearchaeota archaeon]